MAFSACGMKDLPEGDFIKSADSPDGTYRVNAYLCNGGATVDFAVRGEVENLSTGEKRNIYWCYHKYDAELEWIDDKNVVINGVKLDVTKDSYDWRKQ